MIVTRTETIIQLLFIFQVNFTMFASNSFHALLNEFITFYFAFFRILGV